MNDPVVDYFSLDIEGAEYQVLKTIPFESSKIELFGIETAHAGKIFDGSEQDITRLLHENGYEYVARTKLDAFYQKIDTYSGRKKKNVLVIS